LLRKGETKGAKGPSKREGGERREKKRSKKKEGRKEPSAVTAPAGERKGEFLIRSRGRKKAGSEKGKR